MIRTREEAEIMGVCAFGYHTPDCKLAELLKAVKAHAMTPEELQAQRESWVRGEMAMGNDAQEARDRAEATK